MDIRFAGHTHTHNAQNLPINLYLQCQLHVNGTLPHSLHQLGHCGCLGAGRTAGLVLQGRYLASHTIHTLILLIHVSLVHLGVCEKECLLCCVCEIEGVCVVCIKCVWCVVCVWCVCVLTDIKSAFRSISRTDWNICNCSSRGTKSLLWATRCREATTFAMCMQTEWFGSFIMSRSASLRATSSAEVSVCVFVCL